MKCEYCGKSRFDNDQNTWYFNDFIINQKIEKLYFCCLAHSSKFENETNYKVDDGFEECAYCANQRKRENMISCNLRTRTERNQLYRYCSPNCAAEHRLKNGFELLYNGKTIHEVNEDARIRREQIKSQKIKDGQLFYKKTIFHLVSISIFSITSLIISIIIQDILFKVFVIIIFWLLYYHYLDEERKNVFNNIFKDNRATNSFFAGVIEQIPNLYYDYPLLCQ